MDGHESERRPWQTVAQADHVSSRKLYRQKARQARSRRWLGLAPSYVTSGGGRVFAAAGPDVLARIDNLGPPTAAERLGFAPGLLAADRAALWVTTRGRVQRYAIDRGVLSPEGECRCPRSARGVSLRLGAARGVPLRLRAGRSVPRGVPLRLSAKRSPIWSARCSSRGPGSGT
jgi:hypothetical protein